MSRLSAYFSALGLVKGHLQTVEARLGRQDLGGAVRALQAAVREQQTALNAVASIAFKKRPKATTKRKVRGINVVKKLDQFADKLGLPAEEVAP